MKRLIWLPLAGFLLIAGAAVAAAAAPTLTDHARDLFAQGLQGDGPTTVHAGLPHPGQDLLADVLADLVSNGTITQDQSDAITQALADKVDAQRAEMQARMELLRQITADGVITQDEIDQLPADDPLRTAFDSIANDGQVSLDQLRGLGGPGFGHGFGPGHHVGPGMWPMPNGGTDSNGTDS